MVLGVSVAFVAVHLVGLDKLPVFADEAIYIRWAQLILDDWKQYFFFSLNDGKTPLFIWLTTAFLKFIENPLLAGRAVAVLAGLAQLWATIALVKKLGGQKLAVITASLLTFFLPFWYFHHRIALMDGLMTALLSWSWWCVLQALSTKKRTLAWIIGGGIFFGLALWSKLPALLFAPTLLLSAFLFRSKKTPFWHAVGLVAGVILGGLGVFASLKLHPAFSQLFSRGGDFLYSFSELSAQGIAHVLATNFANAFTTLSAYLTLPVLLLPFFGLFQNSLRRKHALLILSALSFFLPIALLGKTVYPRYFLPLAVPLTLSASLAFEAFFVHTQKRIKKPLSFFARTIVLVLGVSMTANMCFQFLLPSWINTDATPFTPADRVQYVTEWSSGHGIRETTDLLIAESRQHSLAVATEGFFGTLPDGILMYLHTQDVSRLMIEGIGQPVRTFPETFVQKAQQYDRIWLVVNSHRQQLSLREKYPELLVREYCRPAGNPCLEVWDVTSLVKQSTP